MTNPVRTPTIFLKRGCPFCMKLQIFVLEANLTEAVELRKFDVGSTQESDIRAELAPHFDKPSFPTMKSIDGTFTNESDTIIEQLAAQANIDVATLATFQDYAAGVLPQLVKMFQENMQLKKQVAG